MYKIIIGIKKKLLHLSIENLNNKSYLLLTLKSTLDQSLFY